MKFVIKDGWAVIQAVGLTIVVPAEEDSMTDDRVEIRLADGDERMWIEKTDDGRLLPSQPEKFIRGVG